ncbi:MAG: AraC family transcriptional regulator, partial [Bacteroidota bacterium]
AFLYYSEYIIYGIHFEYTSTPFLLLVGPLLLAYVLRVNGVAVTSRYWWGHSWPVGLYTLYSMLYYVQPKGKKLHAYLQGHTGVKIEPAPFQYFNVDPLEIHGWVFVEGMALYLLVYAIIAGIAAYRISETVVRRWLLMLSSLVGLMGVIMLLAEGGVIEGNVIYEAVLPRYLTRVHASIVLYFMAIYLLFSPGVLSYKRRYENSVLNDDLRHAKLQKIKQAFEQEKIHLHTDHSLAKLAVFTGLSEHHISEVINLELGMNFYELTNHYRITAAKQHLQATLDKSLSMEQLAYQLGYNPNPLSTMPSRKQKA